MGGPGADDIDCGPGKDVVLDVRKRDSVRKCERLLS